MYTDFYGLTAKPFSLTPDTAFYFNGHQFESAQAILEYALLQQEGVVVITGDAGCGKTSLVHHFLNTPAAHNVGVISNPVVLKEMPLKGVLFAFDLPSPSEFEADLYVELQSFISSRHQAGQSTTLIVDEAQNLNRDTLEELRMLTNPEPGASAALQLILVGQPPLAQTLNLPEWQHFSQLIVTRYHLGPLNEPETIEYIHYRLHLAQCPTRVFTPSAVSRIYSGSAGIPRLINMICDISLMYGYAEEAPAIDEAIVNQVIKDRGIALHPQHDPSGPVEQSQWRPRFLDRDSSRLPFSQTKSNHDSQAQDPDARSA